MIDIYFLINAAFAFILVKSVISYSVFGFMSYEGIPIGIVLLVGTFLLVIILFLKHLRSKK